MAQVLYGDETALFDALAFSTPHPGTLAFINEQASRFSANLNSIGQTFVQTVAGVFDWVDQSKAMALARQLGKKVESLWQTDIIKPLVDISDFQNATPIMQRWIMACPDVRTLYHNQECEGYHGTYVDVDPGMVGDMHYDYRRVMDGYVVIEDDGWHATTYLDELREGDRDLMLDEQIDIQNTWNAMRAHLSRKKDDPTSITGSSL